MSHYTKAYLSLDDNYELPAVRFDTDGCDCCSQSVRLTTLPETLATLDLTIKNLQDRIAKIRALRVQVQGLKRIPAESEIA